MSAEKDCAFSMRTRDDSTNLCASLLQEKSTSSLERRLHVKV